MSMRTVDYSFGMQESHPPATTCDAPVPMRPLMCRRNGQVCNDAGSRCSSHQKSHLPPTTFSAVWLPAVKVAEKAR